MDYIKMLHLALRRAIEKEVRLSVNWDFSGAG